MPELRIYVLALVTVQLSQDPNVAEVITRASNTVDASWLGMA
jgi:hypothetical protein